MDSNDNDDYDAQIDTPVAAHHVIPQRPVSQTVDNDGEMMPEEGYTQHAFALSDVVNEDNQDLEPWPAELEDVNINIAGALHVL